MRHTLPLLALFIGLAQAPTLLADSDEAVAKEAFATGTKLFNEKEFAQAAHHFRRAYEIKATWKLLFNIGQAEAAAKHYGLALESFERYLAEGGDDIGEERRNEILEEIRKMRDMVGDITVNGPDGAVVVVDGIKRQSLPMASTISISAGTEHEVVVQKDDETLFTQSVRVHSAQHLSLSTETDGAPQETDETDGAMESDTENGRSKLVVPGIVMMSVGGAALAGGIVTGVLTMKKKDELSTMCNGSDCYGTQSQSVDDERKKLAIATDVLLIAGGVVAATGLVLVLVGKKSRKTASRLAPVAAPGLVGIQLQGSF